MSQPPPLSANLIVGPLLVTNALSWALWGILSTQLLFFTRDVRHARYHSSSSSSAPTTTTRRRTSRFLGPGHGYEEFEKHSPNNSRFALGFWPRIHVRGKKSGVGSSKDKKDVFADAFDGDSDINPWRMSFVPPPTPLLPPAPAPLAPISAFPSAHNTHVRQRSGKSAPSSSSDPYSPTAVHPSPLDTDSHSIFPPAPTVELPSIYLLLLLCAFYIFICVRTVLSTVQFWRIAVDLWGARPSDLGPRWVGIVLADVIGPLIFVMTVAYFIYALYFASQSTTSNTGANRRSALRPLSLLKNNNTKAGVNILPEPYSYPFPQSPSSPVISNQRHQRQQQQSQTRSSHRWPWQRLNASGFAILEPALLALLALAVTICGFINCARSFKETPLGEPTKLDAVSLIWFAGMFALDLVLCVLLCRALGTRLTTGPWTSRILRVMGEAGGAQLVIALLALVLIVVWREGKPRSTLPLVAPSILPAVYAITVFLHVSSSYHRLHHPHSHPGSHDRSRSWGASTSNPWDTRTGGGQTKSAAGSKYEDIEMGLRSSSRGEGREGREGRGTISPTNVAVPPTRVDLAAAAAAGAGSSTYSTTNSSADGGAALRAQALAYGREREREKERERDKEKENEGELMAEKEAAALGAGIRLHLDRDTHGESSISPSTSANNINNLNNLSTSGLTAPPPLPLKGVNTLSKTPGSRAGRAPSIRTTQSAHSSTLSALSLELPTFRKGKSSRGWRYGYSAYGHGDPLIMMMDDDESGSDVGSEEEWDEELDLDSEERAGETGAYGYGAGTGTWDYGFAKEERERERERAAATLAAGFTLNPGNGNGGTRIDVQSGGGNAGPSTSRRWLPSPSNFPPNKRSSFPSRPSSWRRSFPQPHSQPQLQLQTQPHPLSQSTSFNSPEEANEDTDKLSMLSGTSTTRSGRRRGRRRSYYASHAIGYPPQGPVGNNGNGKRAPRLLPRTPGMPPHPPFPRPNAPPSLASLSSDSLYLTQGAPNPNTPHAGGGPPTPAGSVLVIGRASHPPEPSIAEESIDRAASVAATRASTGSMFSTFSYTHYHPYEYGHGGYSGYGHGGTGHYPRPVQLPDLDVDLAGGDIGDAVITAGTGTGSGGDGAEKEREKVEGEVCALGLLAPGGAPSSAGVGIGLGVRTESRSPHPYSFAGGANNGEGEGGVDQSAARRRWNVHPLKRIAEMGRLKF